MKENNWPSANDILMTGLKVCDIRITKSDLLLLLELKDAIVKNEDLTMKEVLTIKKQFENAE
jgi:hypothetical protein